LFFGSKKLSNRLSDALFKRAGTFLAYSKG